MTVLAAIGCSGIIGGDIVAFYTTPLLLEFVWGMILGEMWSRNIVLPRHFAATALISGLAITTYGRFLPGSDEILAGLLGSPLAVAGALALERNGAHAPPDLVRLGSASYSLFLSPPFLLRGIGLGMQPSSAVGAAAYIAGAASLCVVVALTLHRLIEQPLSRLGHHVRMAPCDAQSPEPTRTQPVLPPAAITECGNAAPTRYPVRAGAVDPLPRKA